MADPRFYDNRGPFTLGRLAAAIGATLARPEDAAIAIADVAPISEAGRGTLAFAAGAKGLQQLGDRRPSALIVAPAQVGEVPVGVAAAAARDPQAAFAAAAALFYPDAGRSWGSVSGPAVHPSARIALEAELEAGVVIGEGVEIGAGTRVCANAVIGRGVRIGRDGFVGPNATVGFTLAGDRVAIGPGSRVGFDGFGFAPGARGHLKVPQLGRVILQDDVEIGANCAIDRGALGDTTIGEGTKLDNLVHIAHNCRIGRHCLITGQVGLSGSVTFGDFVVVGGQAGVAPHAEIGTGARLAAKSGVSKSLAGGRDYAGYPARPASQWRRETAVLARLAKRKTTHDD